MDNPDWDAEMMLRCYIYDYMVRKNYHASAREFKDEAGVPTDLRAIKDAHYGFLMDWWSIFWDIYYAKTAPHGVQQAANFVSPLHKNNQERHNSEFMETGSSSRQPWPPQTQLLQPAMISQQSSFANFPDNSFLRNCPTIHYQQIKPEYHSTNPIAFLLQNWNEQSDSLGRASQNAQPLRYGTGTEPSDLASYLNAMHNAKVQNSPQMRLGQPRLDSSLSFKPNATQQKSSGFPHPAKGIILNEDRNKLRIGTLNGVGSTSMNRESDGLLRFANQHQCQIHGFHAPILGSCLQAQPVNKSDQIPLFAQINKQKVTETDNENQRKRKEPSYSGSEKSFGNREIVGPSKLSFPNPASALKEELASQTLRERHEEAKLPEMIKPLDISGCPKEGSETKDAQYQPKIIQASNKSSLKVVKAEYHEEIYSSTTKQEYQPKSIEANNKSSLKYVKAECHEEIYSSTTKQEYQPKSIEANNKSSLKDVKVEYQEEIYSSTTKQDSVDENGDDKHDQSKLGGETLTAMEGPLPIAKFMNQQIKQDVSIEGGTSAKKSEIGLHAEETSKGDKGPTINHPQQGTLDQNTKN